MIHYSAGYRLCLFGIFGVVSNYRKVRGVGHKSVFRKHYGACGYAAHKVIVPVEYKIRIKRRGFGLRQNKLRRLFGKRV